MLKIRKRDRRGYSKEAQGYDAWTEYQIVDGRRIIGRYELLSQAERAVLEIQVKREAGA